MVFNRTTTGWLDGGCLEEGCMPHNRAVSSTVSMARKGGVFAVSTSAQGGTCYVTWLVLRGKKCQFQVSVAEDESRRGEMSPGSAAVCLASRRCAAV
eukprot:177555-Chlamydomonas_euryale.AAC.9